MILNSMYAIAPNGLCGNDDCGQMSAWYIFSALGFYPVCPGSEEYVLGSPKVVSAEVDFGNDRKLTITTENQSHDNVYVNEIKLNGQKIEGHMLRHSELLNGGILSFSMGSQPEIR